MENQIKFEEGKFKHSISTFCLVNREGYEVEKFYGLDQETNALKRTIDFLIETGYARLIQGPGTWLELDLDKGVVSKDGSYHSHYIPPNFYETLDDEIKSKLK